MNTLELIEVVTDNIADVILNFDNQYSRWENDDLDEYMNEMFFATHLESSNEWVVAFGDDVLIDGLENERQALDMYYFLENLAWGKANNN